MACLPTLPEQSLLYYCDVMANLIIQVYTYLGHFLFKKPLRIIIFDLFVIMYSIISLLPPDIMMFLYVYIAQIKTPAHTFMMLLCYRSWCSLSWISQMFNIETCLFAISHTTFNYSRCQIFYLFNLEMSLSLIFNVAVWRNIFRYTARINYLKFNIMFLFSVISIIVSIYFRF